MRFVSLLVASTLALPSAAWAWGDIAHQLISQAAANRLPTGCLRTFYVANGQALLQASMDPDAWRDTDPDEGPRHYLDIDVAGNPTAYPRDYATSVRLYGAGNGTVPWVAQRAHELLVDAIRSGVANDVVALSGYLSHYASDAHSPYHTTVNYDGQATGNPGIHGRYEADMIDAVWMTVQTQLGQRTTVVTAPSGALSDTIYDALQSGYPMLAGINATDVAARGNVTTLWNQRGSAAVDRMAASASLIAALWQSAYAAAGSPRLAGMPASCGPQGGVDAGPPDTGTRPDSGTRPDAGVTPEAGVPPDSGVVVPADDAGGQPEPEDSGVVAEDTGIAPTGDDASESGDTGAPAVADGGGSSSDASPSGGNGSGGAVRETSGCATTGSGAVSAWLGLVLVLGLVRRRRR